MITIPVAASCSLELSTSQACQIRQAALCSAAVLPQVSCEGRPDTIHSLTGLYCNLICWLTLVTVCCSHSCDSCVDTLDGGRCISRGGRGGGGLLRGPHCVSPAVHNSCQTPAAKHSPVSLTAFVSRAMYACYRQSCIARSRAWHASACQACYTQ